jgi:kinesin family protein 3/17
MEMAQGHGSSGSSCVRIVPKEGAVELMNPKEPKEAAKCFTYDAVYDQNSRQLDIYDEAVRPIVDSVLMGFNGTVFAYGQTGTGKTYTMEGTTTTTTMTGGANDDGQLAEHRGVIPNAIEHIFQHIAHSPPNQQYLVRASFLEIYQEEIRDLLDKQCPPFWQ